MMAGLEKPTSGTVILNGTHIEKMSERKLALFRQKNLGFVFQSYNLLPTMTAQENVAMPLMFSGKKQSVREKKAKQMLLSVGLGGRLKHKPTQMSGGQQQRVAIARAFVSDPPIILADEPTGNLDSSTTIEVMNMIVEMVRKNNQTLIVVTHEPELAVYGDKIIHIKDGHIERMEINENPIRKREIEKPEEQQ
jgi:putative ABC transport system ATP-binding protein